MIMTFRENARYDVVVPTSMGIRITPKNRQPVHTSNEFTMQVTSAESNVITPLASLGKKVRVLTNFVKGSPIARMIKDDLMRRHISYDGPSVDQEGPWGYRHQINIADSGYGHRGPMVQNDRTGEVGRELDLSNFDLTTLFKDEGVRLMHLSGLIASLSKKTAIFCLGLVEQAKKSGTLISFDINYRASFWKNRQQELRDVFQTIAKQSDILIGNEEDFQLALGVEGPKPGGKNLNRQMEDYQTMLHAMEKAYPNVTLFATTLREVINANKHLWGTIVYDMKQVYTVKPKEVQVLDRIGGGDGFVGGLLYGLLEGMDTLKAMQFGWANGALVSSLMNDYSEPIDEEQIWSIWKGNARVKR